MIVPMSLLRDRRGAGTVPTLVLVCSLALGGVAGVKMLASALGSRTDCAGQEIKSLGDGAAPCTEALPELPASLTQPPPPPPPRHSDAESTESDIAKEVVNLVADIIGFTDAKKCITEGDIVACIMTVANFSPWKLIGVGFKLVKNAKRIQRVVDRFLAAKRARKAEQEARSAEEAARKGRRAEETAGKCKGGKCVCFAPGTPVHTESGPVPIEDVKAGDLVWSRDDRTGEEAYRPVVRTFATPDQPVLALALENSSGALEILEVTAPHPFWVQGRGWVAAGDLRPGDEVASAGGGTLRVARSDATGRRMTVYNFEVDDFHTYFVGQSAAWVHNDCEELKKLEEEAKRLDDELKQIEERLKDTNLSGKAKRANRTRRNEINARKKEIEARQKELSGEAPKTAEPAPQNPEPAPDVPLKKTKPGLSDHDAAKDVPSWALGNRPRVGENGNDFAKRLMDKKYPGQKYDTGPGSEYSQIRKWGDRAFEDP